MSGSIPYRCFGAAVSAGFLCGKPSLPRYNALVSSKKHREEQRALLFTVVRFLVLCVCVENKSMP